MLEINLTQARVDLTEDVVKLDIHIETDVKTWRGYCVRADNAKIACFSRDVAAGLLALMEGYPGMAVNLLPVQEV